MTKVLLVSCKKDAMNVFKSILPSTSYTIFSCVQSIQEAKQKLGMFQCDLMIVESPCKDELGVMGVKQIQMIHPCQIVFLVKRDLYDRISYQLKQSGIFVVSMPCKKQDLFQICEILTVLHHKVKMYEKEIMSLKNKLQNDHIVNQAKLVLIENYHWTEERAHTFIEQASMKTSKPKVEIARQLLEKKGENI